jgi:hypothetical protein
VRDHAPVIYKAADVIGGLPADNIRSFMKVPRVIAHGHLALNKAADFIGEDFGDAACQPGPIFSDHAGAV